MSSAGTFRLFVYGTLKRDGRRHHFLARQPCLGAARTRPLYALLDLGPYPALVPCLEGESIEGELYEVDRELVSLLDEVEGAPQLFRLEEVEVEGITGPVQAYFYQRDAGGRARCPEGRWENSRGRAGDDA